MTHISEPRKQMRRPHHKARTGCRNCKARRVKCDEQRPNCGGCTRGGVVCSYFDTICSFNPELKGQTRTLPPQKKFYQKEYSVSITASTANLREVTPPSPDQKIQSTLLVDVTLPIPIGTPTDRLLEVRLFHHYCTMSNQRPRRQGIWSNWIVTISLQNPSVMDALLGFSAFHIRRHSDTDSAIREGSHKYMARAIQSHYKQVQSGVNEYNAAALSASCALILFHTMTNQPYLSLGPGFQLPLHWFKPLKNASNFLAVASPWIQDTGMGNELEGVLKLEPQISPDTPHTFSFLLEGLAPRDEGVLSDYKQAITHLAYIHGSPNYQTLLRFPALVSSRFVHLLEAKDSRALAIVGYFFMLMKLAPLPWWLEGVAERDFDSIMVFLPSKWWPTMQWAIQEFNWSADHLW